MLHQAHLRNGGGGMESIRILALAGLPFVGVLGEDPPVSAAALDLSIDAELCTDEDSGADEGCTSALTDTP